MPIEGLHCFEDHGVLGHDFLDVQGLGGGLVGVWGRIHQTWQSKSEKLSILGVLDCDLNLAELYNSALNKSPFWAKFLLYMNILHLTMLKFPFTLSLNVVQYTHKLQFNIRSNLGFQSYFYPGCKVCLYILYSFPNVIARSNLILIMI